MDGWKITFLLGWPIFRGELLVSGTVLFCWDPMFQGSNFFLFLQRSDGHIFCVSSFGLKTLPETNNKKFALWKNIRLDPKLEVLEIPSLLGFTIILRLWQTCGFVSGYPAILQEPKPRGRNAPPDYEALKDDNGGSFIHNSWGHNSWMGMAHVKKFPSFFCLDPFSKIMDYKIDRRLD